MIAAPAIHLGTLLSTFRHDIAVAAEDIGFKKGYGAYTGKMKENIKESNLKKQRSNRLLII